MESTNAYYRLAGAYLRRSGQGDQERALANYRKALKTSPSDNSWDKNFLDQLRKTAEKAIFRTEISITAKH